MLALDCACGHHVDALDEDTLVQEVKKHVDESHAAAGFTDDKIRELVAQKKYVCD